MIKCVNCGSKIKWFDTKTIDIVPKDKSALHLGMCPKCKYHYTANLEPSKPFDKSIKSVGEIYFDDKWGVYDVVGVINPKDGVDGQLSYKWYRTAIDYSDPDFL